MVRRFALASLVLGVPACGGENAGEDVARLVATESLRIGSIDEPATAITWVTRLAVAEDGTIYSAHQGDPTVLVWSADGEPAGTIGRRGDGPGELRGVLEMGVRGDTLWVMDASGGRLVLYDRSSGGFMEQREARPVPVGDGVSASPWRRLPDGSILARQFEFDRLQRPPVPTGTRYWLLPADGEPVELVRWPRANWAWQIFVHENFQAQAQQPFLSDDLVDVARVDPAVLRVVRAPGAPLRVTRTSFAGDTLWARTIAHEERPVPPEVADSLAHDIATMLAADGGVPLERVESVAREALHVPAALPPVSELLMGRDGTIWLRRELTGEATSDWWVLDAAGGTIGVVALPAGLRALVADRSSVWGSMRDDLDVDYIVRYDLLAS